MISARSAISGGGTGSPRRSVRGLTSQSWTYAGLGAEPVAVLDREAHRGERLAKVRGQRGHVGRLDRVGGQHGLGRDVVEDGSVRPDRDAEVAGRVDQVVQPARRTAGGERDEQAGLVRGGQGGTGARATVPSERSRVPSRSVAISRTGGFTER